MNSVYTKLVFEWDPGKAAANLSKHGVSFDEARSAFADTQGLDGPDIKHSSVEARFLRIGMSALGRILTITYTVRRKDNVEVIRIISARQAGRKEKTAYRQAPQN
ncbi:MAG: BrnT family toxin [Nitrospirae bacterium]|nr:MAG: BrnT family toxin [Nitrospirota bacterium]